MNSNLEEGPSFSGSQKVGQKCLLKRIIYFRFMKIWSISNQSEAEKPPTKHLFPVSEFVPYLYKEKINISEANFSRIWTKKVWTILPIRFKTFHQNIIDWDLYRYIQVNQLKCFCLRQLCYYYHCFDIKSEVSIKTNDCTQNPANGASYLLCNLYAPSFHIWIAFNAFFSLHFFLNQVIFFSALFIFKMFIFIHKSKTFIHNCSMKYKMN